MYTSAGDVMCIPDPVDTFVPCGIFVYVLTPGYLHTDTFPGKLRVCWYTHNKSGYTYYMYATCTLTAIRVCYTVVENTPLVCTPFRTGYMREV